MTEAAKLRPDEERLLRWLLRRADALNFAHDAVDCEEWPNAQTKAEMLEVLEDLRVEAHERFEGYKRELGGPRSLPLREEIRMDEQKRRERELDALEVIAAELERLRILKEHELGAWIEDVGGTLIVKPVQEK